MASRTEVPAIIYVTRHGAIRRRVLFSRVRFSAGSPAGMRLEAVHSGDMKSRRIFPRLSLTLAAALLASCAAQSPSRTSNAPPDVLMLGERHDAPGQMALVADELQRLSERGRLAALAIEMAPAGTSTAALPRDAAATAIRKALAWNDKAWPWDRYAGPITVAVAAGVPVVGANLPQDQIKTAMEDVSLDAQVSDATRARLATAIREGHCGLMPENRIEPMVRVQIARDRSMAHTLAESTVAGRTAVLLAGSGHTDREQGVLQHLPTQLTVRSIALVAEGDRPSGHFDTTWATPMARAGDPCAALALQMTDKPDRTGNSRR